MADKHGDTGGGTGVQVSTYPGLYVSTCFLESLKFCHSGNHAKGVIILNPSWIFRSKNPPRLLFTASWRIPTHLRVAASPLHRVMRIQESNWRVVCIVGRYVPQKIIPWFPGCPLPSRLPHLWSAFPRDLSPLLHGLFQFLRAPSFML